MQLLDNNTKAFLALVRAGLWETDAQLLNFGEIDYSVVFRLAKEQTVIGVVSAGLGYVTDVQIPKKITLQFVGRSLKIEQRNQMMNKFVADFIDKLRESGIYALLVKGQGVAQCYEKPLWRAAGDIDLLLSIDNYNAAKEVLSPIAEKVSVEDNKNKHLALVINGFTVELHGKMPFALSKRGDREMDDVLEDIFYRGNVRSWDCNGTLVFLPSSDNDVILVFTHFLNHFFIEGVGLRQICDWCRLLWTYRATLDLRLLEQRIRQMGLMSEWKAFAAVAVGWLGMPVEAMPFYDARFKVKGEKILKRVLNSGNFGHNKDLSYRKRYKGLSYKIVATWRRFVDFASLMPVFPVDVPRFFFTYMFNKTK